MTTIETVSTLPERRGLQRSSRYPLFLTGAATLVAILMLLPVAYLLVRSVNAGPSAWEFLLRPRTLQVVAGSATLALGSALFSTVIALPIAWLTICTDLPLRRFWTVTTLLPLVVPSYISGFAFVAALGPRGMLQSALQPFGIERLPSIYGFWGALLVITLGAYPYVLLSVRAALQRCDPAMEETARSLGDSPLRTFMRILLPQLRPAIAVGSLLVALYALSDFGAVAMLRFDSFTRAIYVYYRASFDRSNAALLALVLVGLTLLLLLLESKMRGRMRLNRSNATVARSRRPVRLGRWRGVALAYCATLVTVALGIPLLTLLYWLIRGLRNNQHVAVVWDAAYNSMFVSGLAAVLTLVAALPVVLLAVRYPSRASHLLERCAYVGYALPGIVVALALVFFGANYALSLYQTLPMLLLAYMVRFLPQAAGSVRTSLLQMNPRVEDAARSLGGGPLHVLATITAPLLMPGMLSGAALVFLTTMKELPTTLLLSPIGFSTLATHVWGAASEAFFARAAAPALLLILISSLALALLLAQERGR